MLRHRSFKSWLGEIALIAFIWVSVFIVGTQPSFAYNQADYDKVLELGWICSGCDLSGADLTGFSSLDDPPFDGAHVSFTNANLSGIDMSHPSPYLDVSQGGTNTDEGSPGFALIINNGSFSGANLTGANLSGVEFVRCDFSLANLTGANLSSSSFEASKGFEAVFNDVKTDEFTKIDFATDSLPLPRQDAGKPVSGWYTVGLN